jgi:hypothetical protein
MGNANSQSGGSAPPGIRARAGTGAPGDAVDVRSVQGSAPTPKILSRGPPKDPLYHSACAARVRDPFTLTARAV